MSDNKIEGNSNSPESSKDKPVKPETTASPKKTPAAGDHAAAKAATKTESNKPSPAQSKPKPTAETKRPQVKTASSDKGKGLVWLCLLLVVLTLAAGAWLFTQFQQLQAQQQQLQDNIAAQLSSQVQQAVTETQQQISAIAAEQQQTAAKTDATSEDLATLSEAQRRTQGMVKSLADRNPNHWLAAEADYLVKMAGRKLWLERDINSAIALLESADGRVAAMDTPSLTPLRKALAQDIQSLKAIDTIDLSGMSLKLDSLIDHIDNLQVNFVELPEQQSQQAATSVSDDAANWRANILASWNRLFDDLITVRRRNADTEALLAPEQEWFLKENIRNRLLRAQIALYRDEQANYQTAIETAEKWVNRYFDLNHRQTQKTLATLRDLKAVNLQQSYPEQFRSTAPLQQLVNYGHLLPASEDNQ
ncbi:uroporphyrinogen-III C-methyltransferase [Paraferrimonas haliotis]|uniref:Uroporphyrin-3 C-methyltransferase n=1 Tax=Paraferrimonas haliotis TaxID=2013866 RepID=A0AA37TSR3_9GAMM|nr:uroporphyrinogen-III C-methyltransferase [Paraferrimonas haliotis]GLS82240.1 hypothetical protein GCM10007894_02170 [Paraferrimonas haliotis]